MSAVLLSQTEIDSQVTGCHCESYRCMLLRAGARWGAATRWRRPGAAPGRRRPAPGGQGEGGRADVGSWQGLGAGSNLSLDLAGIGAAKHGQLPHRPVAVVVVALIKTEQ